MRMGGISLLMRIFRWGGGEEGGGVVYCIYLCFCSCGMGTLNACIGLHHAGVWGWEISFEFNSGRVSWAGIG